MPIDLYYLPPSPPCRAVMMLAKHLGIHFNLKTVNVLKGEHLKPQFMKVCFSFSFLFRELLNNLQIEFIMFKNIYLTLFIKSKV